MEMSFPFQKVDATEKEFLPNLTCFKCGARTNRSCRKLFSHGDIFNVIHFAEREIDSVIERVKFTC